MVIFNVDLAKFKFLNCQKFTTKEDNHGMDSRSIMLV